MAINNALFEEATGSTISSTEYSLTNDSTSIAAQTTDAILSIWIDCSNMAAGDEYEIAVHEKVVTGGTARRTVLANLVGAQPDPYILSGLQVGNGWDVTMDKIAGTDRSFTWSIRAVTAS
jgi:hypothetical protein